LLFDERLIAGMSTRAVRGNYTWREALSKLLVGTGVDFRNAGSSFVLFRVSPKRNVPVQGSSGERAQDTLDEATLPEILVIGRRTQNADIRRTQNDIQPYRVIFRREVQGAHRDTVEQLIANREPINTQAAMPSQISEGSDTRSSFDFRGLGSLRSLVLVDGHRMPAFPTSELDLEQPDINGIPLVAIERVETRTGTAGGIYGPGALGGVLNLVLRRDYRGAEVRVRAGATSRGDALASGIYGRIGFSPNEGDTGIMVAGSHQRGKPLYWGDRDYSVRQRQSQFANSPTDYLGLRPTSDAVVVFAADRQNLRFDPQYGGVSLGSPITFLPIGFSGTPEEARRLLQQNAGRAPLELAADATGRRRQLIGAPAITSVIANIRHHITDAVEIYIDGLFLRNAGSKTLGGVGLPITLADAANNPFAQAIYYTFPAGLAQSLIQQRSDVSRLSVGGIIRLPGGWSGTGDYSVGRSKLIRKVQSTLATDDLLQGLQRGTVRPDGQVVDPLGPWGNLLSALATYTAAWSSTTRVGNHLSDATLRFAGPILELSGGPMTGTFLVERRREHVPDALVVDRFPRPDRVVETRLFERSQTVSSAYAELRAPLTNEGGPFRKLQVQLALRYDRAISEIPNGVGAGLLPEERGRRSEREALTYTAGAQFYPLSRLMLRGSLATGELPPTLVGLAHR
jgi:outer membrane receptor protein involved in Fe transport